jgi:hypothetical protein
MTKDQLIQKVADQVSSYQNTAKSIDKSRFYEPVSEGKWSPAGHSIHLVKSVKPLNLLFSLPNFVMSWKWGKANRPSRSYDEIVAKYQVKAANIASILPNNPFGAKPSEIPTTPDETLMKVEKAYQDFARKLTKFSEEDLDKYIIPHPLLGKLTLREMAYFTAYHVSHHERGLTPS